MGNDTNVLINLYSSSDSAILSFMELLMKEDCHYVFTILLSCSDRYARVNTEKLMTYIINRCFELEKDILFKYEERVFDETIEVEGENGEKTLQTTKKA
jgi:hypothetical protein